MPAAGRRTMPRLAVGVCPSTSCYAPAVPRSLRLCREGCGEPAFYIRAVRRRVGRLDFRTLAVPRSLRLCRGGCGGLAFAVPDVRSRGARFSFTTSNFFQMSTLIRLRRTAHLPGGTEGVLFFPAESGQSPMATLEPPASGAHPAIPAGEYPLRLDVVSPRFARSPRRWSAAWGGATAAPDAGAGTRGDFDPPRQPTC